MHVKVKKAAEIAVNAADPFGSVRFAAIKDEIMLHPVSKDNMRRLNKIIAVFLYRSDVAHKLYHVVNNDQGWSARHIQYDLEERLKTFKPVQFFLDALQTLLDDVVKEEAEEKALRAAKRANRPSYW